MFGYVMASIGEFSPERKHRYQQAYCGVCRQLRERASNPARMILSYDMAFLALLLMSLYEPEEVTGDWACHLHPLKPRPWTDNEYIRYAADMNVALAYYKALDDLADEGRSGAGLLAKKLAPDVERIAREYPRQCQAMEDCIAQLSRLERENCSNPDEPAACFGQLMGQVLVYREDLWSDTLRQMGMALGRFIYLADAAVDYRRDKRKNKYNPYLAMETGEDWPRWEEYLVLALGRCTAEFEKLPLVQDKLILDNILYSGVWGNFHGKKTQRRDGNA